MKTYIRFTDASMTSIDWALMTSANLSTQAWGTSAPNAARSGEVKISSYELGVLVWPALWDDDPTTTTTTPSTRIATMVPVFGTDMPPASNNNNNNNDDDDDDDDQAGNDKGTIKVGWRMPYDLPIVPYSADEKPWCASEPCKEPDWLGQVWPGFGR